MNLQNFRELLKPIGERFWPKKKVHEAPAFFWQCDQATYDTLDRVGREQVDRYVCHAWYHDELTRPAKVPRNPAARGSVQRLPFDCFILRTDDAITGEQTWRLIADTPVAPFPDDVCAGLITAEAGASLVAVTAYEAGFMNFDVWDARQGRVVRDERSRRFTATLFLEALDRFHGDDPNPPEMNMKLILEWRELQAIRLRPFLFDLFHPANHVVKVSPPAAGRSVQWREGRSHYLVLDRQTMAHVAPSAAPISAADETEAIRRAAHRRRAHLRVLRHPKWGRRVGSNVHVRSAWVGPREWEGPDGKTYVVLDRKPGAER